MLTVSALLLLVGIALATIAGVSPILSGSIILMNNDSQIKGNYHLFPLIYLSAGYTLSLIFFFFGWAFYPTRLAIKWYFIASIVAWISMLAIAMVLYVSLRIGWPGLTLGNFRPRAAEIDRIEMSAGLAIRSQLLAEGCPARCWHVT